MSEKLRRDIIAELEKNEDSNEVHDTIEHTPVVSSEGLEDVLSDKAQHLGALVLAHDKKYRERSYFKRRFGAPMVELERFLVKSLHEESKRSNHFSSSIRKSAYKRIRGQLSKQDELPTERDFRPVFIGLRTPMIGQTSIAEREYAFREGWQVGVVLGVKLPLTGSITGPVDYTAQNGKSVLIWNSVLETFSGERRLQLAYEVESSTGNVRSYTDGIQDDEYIELAKSAGSRSLHLMGMAIDLLR